MPRIRRGGGRLRAGGGRTRNEDCCCDCTPWSSVLEFVEYLRDNGHEPTVIVEGSDFTNACLSGNCNPIIGTYTLPFDFINPTGSGNYEIDWADSFTLVVCGVSRTIFVRVQMFVVSSGPSQFAVDVFLNITNSGGSPIAMVWNENFILDNCQQILGGLELLLLATNQSGGTRRCYTTLADGPVDLFL
jgi:hypothetical protein